MMRFFNQEQRAKILLVSIVVFLVLSPLLERDTRGEIVLIFNMYVTLVAATMELKEKRVLWLAIPVAATSMMLLLSSHLYPVRALVIANSLALFIFFAIVSVSLFAYLGRSAQIASGHLYISVSLYFLLGMAWYALYAFVDSVSPGSFAESGVVLTGNVRPSEVLYFSFATLTTVGYGDVVAVNPAARMLAVIESAAGVLYVAITVARLVSSTGFVKPKGING